MPIGPDNPFKGRQHPGELIILCVRWYLRYPLSIGTANCLLATDNESYTYNKRVNYIPPIAQHHMILRALAQVTEERIAAALNVSVATIRDRRDLLKGICPEAADILRNERVSSTAFWAMRKMKPLRQIDVAQLMLNARKFSGRFARALLDGTREELLVPTAQAKPRATTPGAALAPAERPLPGRSIW